MWLLNFLVNWVYICPQIQLTSLSCRLRSRSNKRFHSVFLTVNCRYLVLFCQWAVSGCTLTVNCQCFLYDSELSDLGGQWGEESRTDGNRHRVDDHREGGQHSGELRLYLDRTGLFSDHRVYPYLLQDLSHQGILQSSQPACFGWPPLEPKRWFLEVCYTT